MAAGETAWLSRRGLARFASWRPGMPSGEAAGLPAPKLGFASWQGVMASGEARGGPPLGPGPGPVDVGVQQSWPTGAGGSMKRRRPSWPWAVVVVGRQCVTRVGSGSGLRGLVGFVGSTFNFQLSTLNSSEFGSLDSFNTFVPLSTLDSLSAVRLVGALAVALGRWPRLAGGRDGGVWRAEGRRTAPTRAGRVAAGSSPVGRGGWAVEGRWGTEEMGDGRRGSNRAQSAQLASWQLASWRGGPCHGSVRTRLVPGPEGAAPRLGFCPRVGKGGNRE